MTKTFSHDEARKASLEYFSGDAMAADVFVSKYALRNKENELLERIPSEMHMRLAKEFARIEAKYPNPMSLREIYGLLSDVEHLTDSLNYSEDELVLSSRGMGEVIAQGSPMSGIGNEYQYQSLSNCFVVQQPFDSYAGIMKTDQEQAQIMKRRGGVGFDVSTIRPRGMTTSNAARTTDGIGVFMERFSNTCREVGQGGRRGALMLTIDIRHPEIETFINIKRDKKKVTGANISIRFNDEFMHAVDSDSEFVLRWPVEADPKKAQIVKSVRARDIWDQIIDAAWYSAEPGVLFWDRATALTPSDIYKSFGFGSISTNPCGEIILSPYDSCRLLVINFSKFVRNAFKPDAYFDFDAFYISAIKAQRLMDDLIDLEIEAVDRIISKIESDPEPEDVKRIELDLWKKIKLAAQQGRRTGLGPTALADTLAMLNIRYGSVESIEWTEKLYKALEMSAYCSSITMAKERGSFPVFDLQLEKDHPFVQKILNSAVKSNELFGQMRANYEKYGRRNIALTTTAPVGSVSILTQTSSGIEPVFLASYKRMRKINPGDNDAHVDMTDDLGDKWQEYTVYHPGVQRWMDVTGKTDIEESPYWKATSADVDWTTGVQLQAAAQKWICHSISRTSNLPKSAGHDLISQIYIEAWKSGCKGFTVYRDESRTGVLLTGAAATSWFENIPTEELEKCLNVGTKNSQKMPEKYIAFLEEVRIELKKRAGDFDDRPNRVLDVHAPKRKNQLECDIQRVNVKGESYTVLVGLLDGKPYEVFCGLSELFELPKKIKSGFIAKNGKKDGVATYNLKIPVGDDFVLFKDIVTIFDNPIYGAFTRTISLALRHGVPVQFLVEQLKKDKHSDLQSFSSVIARVLKGYIVDGTAVSTEKECPGCAGATLVYQQGCVQCVGGIMPDGTSCTWSKC